MITEERLKELIEQGATIYASDFLKIVEVPSGLYSQEINDRLGCQPDYNLLFETKEEAEWYLEFGNITRTETLKLPTWEEFEEMEEFSFDDMYGSSCIIHSGENKDKLYLESVRYIYRFDYSYNGYLEACRVAKKLFLGEEI